MRWLDGITDSNGHKFEQTPGDGGGQSCPVCCRPWGRRVGRDLVTEQPQQRDGQESQPQARFRVTCRGPGSVAGARFSSSVFFH